MGINKIELEQLRGLSYDEGEKMLLDMAYIKAQCSENESCRADSDIIIDNDFILYDEDGEELDMFSHTEFIKLEGTGDGGERLGRVVEARWGNGKNYVAAPFSTKNDIV